jgi:hypothetical protein
MITANEMEEFRLLLPEIILLEAEQFQQARHMSDSGSNESQRWQSYLNALALLGFEQWFRQQLNSIAISHTFNAQTQVCQLQVGRFKLGIIASEHVLDEVIYIPKNIVDQSDLNSQFYVAVEVLEEQGEAIARGFLSHDQLVQYCNLIPPLEAECYPVPMARFNSELNYLVAYCHYLEPLVSTVVARDSVAQFIGVTRTKLSQWFQNVVNGDWMAIETLANPEAQLLMGVRSIQESFQRGKLINLGLQFDDQTVAMIVTITPDVEDKLRVLVQLHPTEGSQFLSPNVQLTLISRAGKVLQTVTSREQDNYIQLKPFKGKLGQRFCIEVSLNDQRIQEEFEF